jgi:hypothetical protein
MTKADADHRSGHQTFPPFAFFALFRCVRRSARADSLASYPILSSATAMGDCGFA